MKKLQLAVLSFVFVLSSINETIAQVFPQDFAQIEVASGFVNATAMAFAPDGRIFVAQQNGTVYVIKDGIKLATPAIKLNVNTSGERGLIGIALHPAFSTTGVIYLHYTLPDGSRNRVSRFWLKGDVLNPTKEEIIVDLDPLGTSLNNHGGGMHFKGDKLYIGVGDNSASANAQNLNSTNGKVLRVNSNGSIPGDNPFYSTMNPPTRNRIWAYGFRNPRTLDVNPNNGQIFINDVGQTIEEINDATTKGKNFGWPATEGATTNLSYNSPVFSYPHGSGETSGCVITGGTFFTPAATNYPSKYLGKYFYQDGCNNWINILDFASGKPVRSTFATGLPAQSLRIDVGSDGNLYFLSRSTGKLYKIVHSNTQTILITKQPIAVTVKESASATFSVSVFGASPVAYQWKKNNINIPGATSANLTITNAQLSDAGAYSVVVSNPFGSVISNTAHLTVYPGGPTLIYRSNTPGFYRYRAGETKTFQGVAQSPATGMPYTSFTFRLDFYENNKFLYTQQTESTNNVSFAIPNWTQTSSNVFYRVIFIARNSAGSKDYDSLDLHPYVSKRTFVTDPPGLKILLDGGGDILKTPADISTVIGQVRYISVATPQTQNGTNYMFANWSDGSTDDFFSYAASEYDESVTANFVLSTGPWSSADVGPMALLGCVVQSYQVFRLLAAGKDIWNRSDEFHFVYQPFEGNNLDFRAFVSGIGNTEHSWAKAGLMIRETLQPDSKNVMNALTQSHGFAFQRRTQTGGLTISTASSSSGAYWLRLVRNGNLFSAYKSTNGTTWTLIGSQTFEMSSSVYVGMALTSHAPNARCIAAFSQITLMPGTTSASLPERTLINRSEFSLFPNPVRGNVIHLSTMDMELPAQVEIVNTLGQTILEHEIRSLESSGTYPLDVERVPKGIYFLRMESSSRVQKASFIRE